MEASSDLRALLSRVVAAGESRLILECKASRDSHADEMGVDHAVAIAPLAHGAAGGLRRWRDV